MQTPDLSLVCSRFGRTLGTSMASPHVAGIVALMQSAAVRAGRSPLTPMQVKKAAADDVDADKPP